MSLSSLMLTSRDPENSTPDFPTRILCNGSDDAQWRAWRPNRGHNGLGEDDADDQRSGERHARRAESTGPIPWFALEDLVS